MNTFGTKSKIKVESKEFSYHSFETLKQRFGKAIETLPYSLSILLENLLRYEDGKNIKSSDIEALINWNPKEKSHYEIQFTPSRVLLQDFTGIPVVADLTAM